jgi:hypothetical protein
MEVMGDEIDMGVPVRRLKTHMAFGHKLNIHVVYSMIHSQISQLIEDHFLSVEFLFFFGGGNSYLGKHVLRVHKLHPNELSLIDQVNRPQGQVIRISPVFFPYRLQKDSI